MIDIILEIKTPLDVLKNPFDKSKVEDIHIHYWRGTGKWSASVEFKNGNTEGTQKFSGDDFNVVVFEMNEFLKSL